MQSSKRLTITLLGGLMAAVAIPLPAMANPPDLEVTHQVRDERVFLSLANSDPNMRVYIERVVIANGIKKKGRTYSPVSTRELAVNQPLLQLPAGGESLTLDAGDADTFFNGGGTTKETAAIVRENQPNGPAIATQCSHRRTPIVIHSRVGQLLQETHTSVAISMCNGVVR